MRILVTGGAGYVGGFCARSLQAAGHDVTALDNLSEGHRQALAADSLVVGDLADGPLLRDLFSERRIEAVMHFAASTYVGVSVEDPGQYWRNNVGGTLSLLEAMRDCDVPRIVFSSTCAQFSEHAEMPLSEDSPKAPNSPYAFTKFCIEQMLADFERAHGLRYAALRYFNASGADPAGTHGEDHRPETHLIPLAIQALQGKRDSLALFGTDYPTPDGTCIRDYVHVLDLADAHERALAQLDGATSRNGRAYNLGTGQGHSVREVVDTVERVSGRRVPTVEGDRRPGDVPSLIASSERARSELGWTPRYATLASIVETAWAWHEGHPDGYGESEE